MISASLLHEAEGELSESVAYYEKKSAGLGLDFLAEIKDTLQAICHFPERWPLHRDGTRRCLAQRFPYWIIYTYRMDHIWVIAFAHCKRRPDYWKNRLKATE